MAAYEIPWAVPDLRPGAQMLLGVLQQNRENARADDFAKIQRDQLALGERRLSAEEARRQYELKTQEDERKRTHAIQRNAALPSLFRAAQNSVGQGNLMGQPYGVQFKQNAEPPPSIAGMDLMQAGKNAYGDFARDTLAGRDTGLQTPDGMVTEAIPEHMPDHEYLDAISGGGRLPPGGSPILSDEESAHVEGGGTLSVRGGTTVMDPIGGLSAVQQAAAQTVRQPPKSRLMASIDGQEFDVPETSNSIGLGAEYDVMFNTFRSMPGMNDEDALKLVTTQYKADKSQEAMGNRLATRLTQERDLAGTYRPDVSQQDEWKRLQREQSERNARIGGAARVASADPAGKADAVNARLMGLLDARMKQVRATGQFNKLAQSDKTVRGIMINIANGAVPLQHADAQIQLAKFFRGTTPTEGEMRLLYHNLGGTADKWNQFVAKMANGDLSAEQLRQVKASAKAVQKEHAEDVHRFMNVAKSGLGPGSGLDMAPDQAQAMMDMLGAELGFERGQLPPLYQTEGGVTAGSGQRPSVKPKGGKKSGLDELEANIDALIGGH